MILIPPPIPRYICVRHSEQLSADLQRVYFSSDDFSQLSSTDNGAHIKLFFPEQATLKPPLPHRNDQGKVVWGNQKKPIARTYTLRKVLQDEQLLVIDFVRHHEFGIAADWAIHAKSGQILGLAGPGGPARFNPNAHYWIFIGDLSAVAMIAASLEQLPSDAQGVVWIELAAGQNPIHISHPQDVQIHWLANDPYFTTQIEQALNQLDWSAQHISVSLAGENTRVIQLRHLLRNKYKVHKTHLYAVPYWKKGQSEESYHQERHQVMDD